MTGPFAPIGVTPLYKAPRATIDPRQGQELATPGDTDPPAHKGIFITSLVLSFVGLVLQVQIPKLLNDAIDNSFVATRCRSTTT